MSKLIKTESYAILVHDIGELYDYASYYTPFHEDWLKSVGWSFNTLIRKPLRLPRQI